VPNESG